MEAKTIKQMLDNNEIIVPDYQRAYSWETSLDGKSPSYHVNTFLRDLQDYVKSHTSPPPYYYFGHFLFEQVGKNSNVYNIIDGQQRITTIIIFLVCLYKRLSQLRELTHTENQDYESMVKLDGTYHFSTVRYDNQFFRDYVIDQTRKDTENLGTISQQRIATAFGYLNRELSKMTETEVCALINAVSTASCSTYVVDNEVEAIQMFIFQNNRGKKPSNLEIIKAQFMYNIHLYGANEGEKRNLLGELNNRFEGIYKSISSIEDRITEDSVLTYTLRVYYNSLHEWDALGKISEELGKDNRIKFIEKFTEALANSFNRIVAFFNKEKEHIELHSVQNIADYGILMPFVIKAYGADVSNEDFIRLCKALESIFVRHRVIGTRAGLAARLNEKFKHFYENVDVDVVVDVDAINEHIEWMKTRNDWWGYWNNDEFERCLKGRINHDTAKKLLWRYENSLRQEKTRCGYKTYMRYDPDSIRDPQLEHIAPINENKSPNNGYFPYKDDWQDYVDCLGNYLLLNGSHNESISNGPFVKKRETYTQLYQQFEIREMTENDLVWDQDKIIKRKKKIIKFLLENY